MTKKNQSKKNYQALVQTFKDSIIDCHLMLGGLWEKYGDGSSLIDTQALYNKLVNKFGEEEWYKDSTFFSVSDWERGILTQPHNVERVVESVIDHWAQTMPEYLEDQGLIMTGDKSTQTFDYPTMVNALLEAFASLGMGIGDWTGTGKYEAGKVLWKMWYKESLAS